MDELMHSRCCSGSRASDGAAEDVTQGGVVVGDDDAHAERRAGKEKENAPDKGAEGGWQHLARVLGLAGDHGDVFGATHAGEMLVSGVEAGDDE